MRAGTIERLKLSVAGGLILGLAATFSVSSVEAKGLAEQWLDGEIENSAIEFSYDGPPVSIRINHFLGSGNPLMDILERAVARLQDETGGKLNPRIFYSNSLHDGQRGGFEGVAGGISDVSTCYSWINPGGFNLQLGLQFPFLFDRSTVGAHAIMQIYPEYFKEDYEGHGVYFARSTVTPPQQLITRGDPITSLEDLPGKRMMASGAIATDITSAFGAVPVPLTVAEYYSGFQQGVVDVMVIHDAGLKLFRFDELARSRTVTNLWANPIEYCMNQDFFDGLPEDLQHVFQTWLMRLNHAEAELYFDDVAAIGRQALVDRGVETTELSEEEYARWVAAAQPVVDAWVQQQETAGRPASQMLEDLRAKITELDAMSNDELFMLTFEEPYPGLID
jgi:TRAP-type transport system periplasmic protein